MEDIHSSKQLEYKEWEKPDSIVEATICTKCGNLAVFGLCDEAEGGSCIKKEFFAKGTVPTRKCTCHARVTICKKSKLPAGPYCPEKSKVTAVLLIKNEDPSKYPEGSKYSHGYSTWDTPYIYNPEHICDKHTKPGATDDDVGDDDNLFGEGHQIGAEDDVYED